MERLLTLPNPLLMADSRPVKSVELWREKKGEKIADINRLFPLWFCDNYKKFNDKENELPIDQHELLALIAPRLLYISSSEEDIWADPKSEFLSCVAAVPVYKLHNLNQPKGTIYIE